MAQLFSEAGEGVQRAEAVAAGPGADGGPAQWLVHPWQVAALMLAVWAGESSALFVTSAGFDLGQKTY